MNTAKREAQSLPMNEQKRPCKGVPSVKKVNFTRKDNCVFTVELQKANEIQRNTGLKVKRCKRSRRRSSYNGSGKSKNGDYDEKPLTSVYDVFEQKNCCGTPVARRPSGNDIQESDACAPERIQERKQSLGQQVFSPFETGIKSVVNNTSFYDDDVALAALNLSEIITSSSRASNEVEQDHLTNSLQAESNQFYGLPLKVKELLHKFKGIETLYGKLDLESCCLLVCCVYHVLTKTRNDLQ